MFTYNLEGDGIFVLRFKNETEGHEVCQALQDLITVQKISNRSFLAAVSLILQAMDVTKKSTFTEMLTPQKSD